MLFNNILKRNEIVLPPQQEKLLERGWGKEAISEAVVERIIYLSDEIEVTGFIAYPRSAYQSERKYPCILWNRGGFRDEGIIDDFTAKGVLGQIASWGYVVFASMYRGNSFATGNDEAGGKDLNDIVNIMVLAEQLPFADISKWAAEGWSRGGMMNYLLLKAGIELKTVVMISAISDFRGFILDSFPISKIQQHPLMQQLTAEDLRDRSAVEFIDQLPIATKYLLIHGASDTIVSPEQTLKVSQMLTARGASVRTIIFEEGDHFLRKHRKEIEQTRRNWFARYL
ncbi:MAG: prolyl oligopeptidase family serine peptidase [Ignavibacteria bacterium]|nr:prolyl oligopeptidase family serine peptidase [Ignavibacteria bacterium]